MYHMVKFFILRLWAGGVGAMPVLLCQPSNQPVHAQCLSLTFAAPLLATSRSGGEGVSFKPSLLLPQPLSSGFADSKAVSEEKKSPTRLRTPGVQAHISPDPSG